MAASKADDREVARHMQDGLNDGFAYLSFRVIQLCGVVPREGGAIVAVIDITVSPVRWSRRLKDNRRIGLIVVMIFKDKFPREYHLKDFQI